MIQLFADYCVAPEIYKDEIFDRSVDSYSFGVVLYEVGTFWLPLRSSIRDNTAPLDLLIDASGLGFL